MCLESKFFFFQPASRVTQEESPIKKMVSKANTCDYLIVNRQCAGNVRLSSSKKRKQENRLNYLGLILLPKNEKNNPPYLKLKMRYALWK
jgi:hypothetical protein